MYIKFVSEIKGHEPPAMHIHCPFCGGLGTFYKLNNITNHTNPRNNFSLQYCPNKECNGFVLGVYENEKLIKTYPGIGKPINTENIPDKVKAAFKESVECFANNNHIASAIMIRKTLEEICIDKEATGANLYKKIENLSDKVILPKDLKEAMHELRILGNDAAHIEAQAYNEIGIDELTISIDFTQEIVKAIYQYENLLNKLRSLKKSGDSLLTNPE